MTGSEKQKPVLRLGDPRNLQSIVAFIEEMSGEEMTPDQVEEVRQALDLPSS